MRVLVTGASGWIGSAVVPELLGAGHEVVGLARSDASAAALRDAGAEVHRGDLDHVDGLRQAAAAAEGVVHLAYRHDLAFSGQAALAVETDRRAIEVMGEVLEGSGRPLVIASGTAVVPPGAVVTERDGLDVGADAGGRLGCEQAALAFADRGVRSVVVRLAPTNHGDGDNGFLSMLVGIARDRGSSAYVADGSNRWPAVHRLDTARLFRLAVERAQPGTVLHAVAEEGVPLRAVAEVIGRHLEVPVESVTADAAGERLGWLGGFVGLDCPASSALTREWLDWSPTQPGLLADLEQGHYFRSSPA